MAINKSTRKGPASLDHPVNKGVTTDIVDLTPALAAEWLGANHHNRNVRPVKVRAYARDIADGRWTFAADPIRFDWNRNMIDGQHRCLAVIEAGVPIRQLVVTGLDPDAQTVMDSGARRSAADALRFKGYEHEVGTLAAVAKAWTAWDGGQFARSAAATLPDLTTAEVLAWVDAHPEVQEAATFARRVYRGIGSTPTALTLAFMVLADIDSRLAIEFFESAAEARTHGRGDPRYAMLRAFQNVRTSSVARAAGVNLSLIFRAWNAWVSGKTVTTFPLMSGSNGVSVYVAVPKPIAPKRGVKL